MARIARVVAPGCPHHVTQRGNRRQQTFFCDDDYLAYIDLMAEWCHKYQVDIWAWCLMPNHVHLIVVPQSDDGDMGTDLFSIANKKRRTALSIRPCGVRVFRDPVPPLACPHKTW